MRRYGEVTQRVLLLTGDADWLIPSREEGPRLEKALPRCNLRVRKVFNTLAHANFNTENQIWVCQEGAVWRRRRPEKAALATSRCALCARFCTSLH